MSISKASIRQLVYRAISHKAPRRTVSLVDVVLPAEKRKEVDLLLLIS